MHLATVRGEPGVGLAVARQVEPGQADHGGFDRLLRDAADHVAARPAEQHRGLGHVDRDEAEFFHPVIVTS